LESGCHENGRVVECKTPCGKMRDGWKDGKPSGLRHVECNGLLQQL